MSRFLFSFIFKFDDISPNCAWVGDASVMYKSGDTRNVARPMETSAWSGEQSWKAIRRLKKSSLRDPEVKIQQPDSTFYWAQLPSTEVKREGSREQRAWRAMRRLKKSFSGIQEVRRQEPGAESKEQSWRAIRRLKKSFRRTPEVRSNSPDSFLYW